MEVIGVRIVSNPASAAMALGFIGVGIALGTISGLLPGLHVNTVAVLMGVVASDVPGPPHLIGASMLAAGITHSFLDIVPTLAIGVPDASMAVSALPGHRLVLGGRGREALRISAIGSASAIVAAVVLGPPITVFMKRLDPFIDGLLPILFVGVAVVLTLTERGARAKIGGAISFLASGVLGLLLLDIPTNGLVEAGDTLLPLLSGLFGIPVLVYAYRGGGIPPQDDAVVTSSRRATIGWGLVGTMSGAVVAYVPGVSAAVAAALAFAAMPVSTGDRPFIATVSGVNTANAIFGLFALHALGDPRNGVLVAFENARLPPNLPLLLVAVAIAAGVSFVLVPVIGDRYLRATAVVDTESLTLGVLALLVVLAWTFTGITGVGILGIAAAVGMLPMQYGARRVHLMGVLLVPLTVRALTG